MAGGISLGSASFELLADDSQLLASLVRSQAAAQNAASAIKSAVNIQAQAGQQANAVLAAAYQQGADAAVKAAQQQAQVAAQAKVAYDAQATAAKGASTDIIMATLKQVDAENKAADARAASVLRIIKADNDAAASARYAAQARAEAALKTIRADNDAADAAKKGAGGLGDLLKAGVALGAGLAGVQLGIAGVRAAIADTYDATVKLSNAQFSLAAAYGGGAEALAKYADAQSRSTEFSKTNIEQGAAIISALQKEAGFTNTEQEQLLTRAQDLAAAYGKDLPQALSALENALKGRAGALSQFGALINEEVIKEYGGLTDAERKNYAQLPEATRLRAGLNAVMILTANSAGKAEEHLNTLGGSTANLEKSTGALAAVIGKSFEPGLVNLENSLAKGLQDIADFFAKVDKQIADREAAARNKGAQGPIAPFEPAAITDANAEINRRIDAMIGVKPLPADTRAADEGPHESPSDVANTRNTAIRAKAEADALQRIQGEAIIRSLHEAHDARIRDLTDQKTALERRRDAEVKAAEASKQTRLDAIRDQAQDAREGFAAELALLRDEETTKKKAVEDERQATVDRIAAEKQAYDDAAAERIRVIESTRNRVLQSVEAEKQGALDALAAEKRARDDARVIEDRALDDAARKEQQRIDDLHTANVRALDDESKEVEKHKDKRLRALDDEERAAQHHKDARVRAIDDEERAAQRAHDRTIRRLDDQVRAEDDRHRKALANIEAEAKRQTDAIDAQIKAIDDAQRATQDADRTAGLRQKLTEAQAALTRAQGTGTPEQVAGAREDLTTALRVPGNELGVANARERLNQLAGQGAEAVKKALQDVADAQKTLLEEGVKENQDAQKQQLQDQKAAIKDRADAEKQAEDERDRRRKERLDKDKQAADDTLKSVKDRATQEKQAADDTLKKVKESIDGQKRAVDDQTKHALEAIDGRKRAEQDTHDAAVRAARDTADQAKRAVDDRRRTEDEADQDRRTQIERTAKAEQDAIHATYDDPETGSIAAIRRAQKAADEGYAAQIKAAQESARAQIDAITDQYNNAEHGLIPLTERAAAAVALGFANQTHAVEEASKAEIAAIKDVYVNDQQTGLIDRLDAARIATDAALKKDTDAWVDWQKGLTGENGVIKQTFDEAAKQFDAFIKHITENKGSVSVSGVTEPSFRGDASDDGHGPGPGVGAGSDQVPDPYEVQFPFGARYSNPFNADIPIHRGVDVTIKGAPNGGEGRPVEAFEDGEVVYQSYDSNGGNGVIIRGADGLYHRYFHFDSVEVSRGDRVHAGDVLGTLGQTGTEGSPHLHYEVSKNEGGDPIGDLIDPVPYMSKGGTKQQQGGRTFSFTLFGRTFTVTLPGGASGGAIIDAIERLAERIGGREFGHAAAAIALSEGADGDLTRPGQGGARGPFQFDPDGELPNYAAYLHKDLGAAGDYAGSHPLDAAAWALRGYLGDALREGLDQGLKGADLAEYGSLVGQRPEGDNYKRAGDASRRLWGYRYGGWIPTPSLIVDAATMSPYAYAGEAGPERVLSPEHSRDWSGTSAGPTVYEGDVIFNGLTYEEAETRQRRQRRVDTLLRGAGRLH